MGPDQEVWDTQRMRVSGTHTHTHTSLKIRGRKIKKGEEKKTELEISRKLKPLASCNLVLLSVERRI